MSVRHQPGYLRLRKRKNGNPLGFMWREQQPSVERVHSTTILRTAEREKQWVVCECRSKRLDRKL